MRSCLARTAGAGSSSTAKRDGTKTVAASRWSLQRDDQGRPIATLETNNDVTERKQAEEGLRASEQVARAQVEALSQSLDILATASDAKNLIGQMLSTIGRFIERAKRGLCGCWTN